VGRPHVDPVNSCTLAPDWVVYGPAILATGEVVNAVVTCCDGHQGAVVQWLSSFGGEALVAPVEALPTITAWLFAEGDEVWEPVAAATA